MRSGGTVPQRLVILAAVVVATVVIAVSGRDSGTASVSDAAPSDTVASPTATNPSSGPAGDLPRRADDDPLVLGHPDAPVTMVVFNDFGCEYCGYYLREIQPALIDRYVRSDVLRIEWRDAPMMGPESYLAARAGRAAARQGKFWQFVRTVMDSVPIDEQPMFTRENLVDMAARADIPDTEEFDDDLENGDFETQIQADLALAKSMFLPPSPAFWINGSPLLAGQPLEVFVDVIEGKRL